MTGHTFARSMGVAVSAVLLLTVIGGPAMAKQDEPSAVGGGRFEFANGNYGTITVNARPTETVDALATTYDGKGRVNVKVYKPDGTLVQHFNGRVTQYTAQTPVKAGVCGEIKVMKGEKTAPYFAILVVDRGQPPQAGPLGDPEGDWFKFLRYDGDVRSCPDGAFAQDQRFLTTGNLKVRYEE